MATTMTTENICINAAAFNPSKHIRYTKPKVNKSGGKSVGILNSATNKQLMLSTPLMLTWGVQKFIDEKTGKESYDMALQFPSSDYATEQTSAFLKAIEAFEAKIKQSAVENSKEWLNKAKMSEEVVDALFHPMLKYPKDKNTQEPDYTRSPTLKVKLDFYDEQFNCEIYDLKQKMLFPLPESMVSPSELIVKGSNVATVIKCGGLWFANGKFGCTWKLEQAVVKPRSSFKGQCLINLSSEDTERLQAQQIDDEEETETALVLAEDSDVEEETAPVQQATPVQQAAPVQQVAQAQAQAQAQAPAPVPAVAVAVAVAQDETSSTPVVVKKKVIRRKKENEAEAQ
jgi:hypothetical protein